jgi:choline kinase
MKGVILAAGVASRLRPLSNNTPKCLLHVGQKSILERTIDNLVDNGIDEVIIGTGYKEEMIRDFIKVSYPSLMVQYVYNELYETTNNIYSLWLTRKHLLDSDMVLMDSDIIFDKQIINLLLNAGKDNCIAVKSDHDLAEEEMKVFLSKDFKVEKISKEIDPKQAAGESMGIAKFSSSFVQLLFEIIDKNFLKKGRVNDFYEAAFQEAIDAGQEIFSIDVEKYQCIEIDTIEDIKEAEQKVLPNLK